MIRPTFQMSSCGGRADCCGSSPLGIRHHGDGYILDLDLVDRLGDQMGNLSHRNQRDRTMLADGDGHIISPGLSGGFAA